MERGSHVPPASDDGADERRRGEGDHLPPPRTSAATTASLGIGSRSQPEQQHVEGIVKRLAQKKATATNPPPSSASFPSPSRPSGSPVRQRPPRTSDMIQKPRNDEEENADITKEEEEEETEDPPVAAYSSDGTSFPAMPGSKHAQEKDDEEDTKMIANSASARRFVEAKAVGVVEEHCGATFRHATAGAAAFGATPMDAPRAHRIPEGLAVFPHHQEAGYRVGSRAGRESEANMSPTVGGRPGHVTTGSRSLSGSSSSEASQSMKIRKKKARTEKEDLLDQRQEEGLGDVDMLNISAIISQVDRKNMDTELAQLVKELDDDVAGQDAKLDRAGPTPGIKLRRRAGRNGRRRFRKARPSNVVESKSPSLSPSSPLEKTTTFPHQAVASSDDNSITTEDNKGNDGALRTPGQSFLNFLQAKEWASSDAFGPGDSVAEGSTTLASGETEDELKRSQGRLKDPKLDSSAIQLLREVWESCTCNPFCDSGHQPPSSPTAKEATSATTEEDTEGAKSLHTDEEAQFLEFIDAAFFEELWKAAESIDFVHWHPIVMFTNPKDRSLPDHTSTCSLASTIPTFDDSVEPGESPLLESTSEPVDHSAVLAECLARGSDGGDSPIAKKKADRLLRQCEKKFPSLHARIIARLESRAGAKSSIGWKTLVSGSEGTTRPPEVVIDEEEDSLFSQSGGQTPTNPELENKTHRVRNFKRENNEPAGLIDSSHETVFLIPMEGSDQNTYKVKGSTVASDGLQTRLESTSKGIVASSSVNGRASFSKFDRVATTSEPELAVSSSIGGLNDGVDEVVALPPGNNLNGTMSTDASDSPAMPDYTLLNSSFNVFDNEADPSLADPLSQTIREDVTLFQARQLAYEVVSPLTIDSRESHEDMALIVDPRETLPIEEGIEITDILADLTTTPTKVMHSPLDEWEDTKFPILSPSSTGANRTRFARSGSVPRSFYSRTLVDAANAPHGETFPVVLKHRILHKKKEFISIQSSREGLAIGVKPRRLDDFFDCTASTKEPSGFDMRSIRSDACARRSPTSFPSLFSKEQLDTRLVSDDVPPGCSEDANMDDSFDALRDATVSKATWKMLVTPTRERDETKDALLSAVEAEQPHPNFSWLALPTPPRGTYRPGSPILEEQVPILTPPQPGAIVPLKGTKAKVRRKDGTTKSRVGSPRESSIRMLRQDRAPTKFRRLASTN